ncbi:MAG: VanZ family protein [Gammaproteobacteria bacterium]
MLNTISIRTNILVLALFVTCTAITGTSYVQYQPVYSVLEVKQTLGTIEDWSIRGPEGDVNFADGTLHLTRSAESIVSAFRHFRINEIASDQTNRFFVNATATVRKTQSDPNSISIPFDGSSIMVVSFFSNEGERLIVHIPLDITHGQDKETVNDYIKVPSEATEIAVGFYIREALDQFSITNLALTVTKKRAVYHYFVAVLFSTFLIYLLIIFRQLLNSRSTSLTLSIAGISAIFGGVLIVLIPGLKEKAHSWLWQFQTQDQPHVSASIAKFLADNIEHLGHITVFFVISVTAFSLNAKHQLPKLAVITTLTFFAIGTEAVQLHISDRSATFVDLAYDIFGIALGGIIVWLVQFSNNKLKSSSGPTCT